MEIGRSFKSLPQKAEEKCDNQKNKTCVLGMEGTSGTQIFNMPSGKMEARSDLCLGGAGRKSKNLGKFPGFFLND